MKSLACYINLSKKKLKKKKERNWYWNLYFRFSLVQRGSCKFAKTPFEGKAVPCPVLLIALVSSIMPDIDRCLIDTLKNEATIKPDRLSVF